MLQTCGRATVGPKPVSRIASSGSVLHRLQCRTESTQATREDQSNNTASPSIDKGDEVLTRINNHDYKCLRPSFLKAPHTGVIRKVDLYRPHAKNSISRAMLEELSREVEAIHSETSAKETQVLIIGSASEDVFCAGADLKERKTMSEQETKDFLTSLRHTFSRLAALPIPTIACVSGAALGGGLELALCCDFRVFSQSAKVGLPETRLAIIPGAGGTYRLAQAIGLSRAKEMILTGRRIDATEAFNIGLCHRLARVTSNVPQSNAEYRAAQSTAIGLAHQIASGGPVAQRAVLEALRGGSQEAENEAYQKVLKTSDRVEALMAFAEKRAPRFDGE